MYIDWRPIIGLDPTPRPGDPVERVITLAVVQKAHELRKTEIDYAAWRTAKYLAG